MRPDRPEVMNPVGSGRKIEIDRGVVVAAVVAVLATVWMRILIQPIARRQPWQVARDFATLDRLSNGRVMLGAGLGRRPEYDKFGVAWDPKPDVSW